MGETVVVDGLGDVDVYAKIIATLDFALIVRGGHGGLPSSGFVPTGSAVRRSSTVTAQARIPRAYTVNRVC